MNTDRLLQKIDTVLNDTEQQLQAGINQVLDIGEQRTVSGPRLENPLAQPLALPTDTESYLRYCEHFMGHDVA